MPKKDTEYCILKKLEQHGYKYDKKISSKLLSDIIFYTGKYKLLTQRTEKIVLYEAKFIHMNRSKSDEVRYNTGGKCRKIKACKLLTDNWKLRNYYDKRQLFTTKLFRKNCANYSKFGEVL